MFTSPPSPAEIMRLRRRLGLTQQALAERLGVSYSTVQRWESGARRPTRFALQRLEALMESNDGKTAEREGDAIGAFTPPDHYAVLALREQLILFDPAQSENLFDERRRFRAPVDLGPISWVGFDRLRGRPALIIGARDGVHVLPYEGDRVPIRFRFGQLARSDGAVTSALIRGDWLYATHGEHGLWRWRLDHPTIPERPFAELLRGRHPIRSLTSLDGERALLIAGRDMYAFSVEDDAPRMIYSLPDATPPMALVVHEHAIYCANAEGRAYRLDLVTREQLPLFDGPRSRFRSADLIRFMERPWLALGCERDEVTLVSPALRAETLSYRAAEETLGLATATTRHVIACDRAGEKLLVWDALTPEAPVARFPILATLGETARDLRRVQFVKSVFS